MAQTFACRGSGGAVDAFAARLAEAGLRRVEDVASADVVFTYFASQTALEDCYFGDDGLVQMMAPSSLVVDLSSTTPGFARELNAVATVSDLIMIEAPIIVKDIAAEHAFGRENLSCFVAGDDKGLARALPLLDALCSSVHETGGPGEAQLARASHTLQVAAQVVSAVEADALFKAAGRSASGAMLPEALSSQAAAVLEAVRHERFDGAYRVEMLMAELSAAIMAADDVELILPQAEASLHLLELLAVIGGSDKSPAALSLVYGEEAACARNGLDWSRAEAAYGYDKRSEAADDFDAEGDEGDDYDYDYDGSYPDGFDYSSN